MRERIFGVLQRVGRAFMLPIAILPVAGLLLGIGSSFTNETWLQTNNLLSAMGPGTLLYTILSVMAACGDIVFTNLSIIFAVGVAIGMAKKEKEVAALSGAIAFFVMHSAIGAMLKITGAAANMLPGAVAAVVGIESLQMGVFGGIIVGLGVAALHNRFYKIELPQVLAFFGGTRFVPIISAAVYAVVGVLMFILWPPVQNAMYSVGDAVRASGYGGTLLYGIMERALIPFGLHHVFYMPFWQTAVGGSMTIDGVLVEGAQNIFFAQLASESTVQFSVEATRFMSGKFPFMIFGLPLAAYAMYRCAFAEHKKIAGGLLFSAALTSILTGITEPLEFTFLFVSPLLYAVHCVLAGASYMLMHIFGVGVGMTFSGGFIDLLLFGILEGNDKTHWVNIVWVGLAYAAVYYFLFLGAIKKFKLKTPGREDSGEETKLYRRADVEAAKGKAASAAESASGGSTSVSALILQGLGGKANVSDVDSCATRLRVTVFDANKVDEAKLKQSGAAGIIKKGTGVQVIYGPRVSVIKSELVDYISTPEADIEPEEAHAAAAPEETPAAAAPAEPQKSDEAMAKQGESYTLYAPLNGKILPLSEVPDEMFSNEILGKGIAILPDTGAVYAPADGVIEQVADTCHAIGITTDDGIEILIHVGIDTVKLNGQCFDVRVKDGAKIKKGELLLEFDISDIIEAGYPVVTPIIVTNSDDYAGVLPLTAGAVKEGGELLRLVRN